MIITHISRDGLGFLCEGEQARSDPHSPLGGGPDHLESCKRKVLGAGRYRGVCKG